MNTILTVYCETLAKEKKWEKELQVILDSRVLQVQKYHKVQELGQIIFLESGLPQLEVLLEQVSEKGRAVFVIQEYRFFSPNLRSSHLKQLQELIQGGQVDGIILYPFRSLEVLSQVWRYPQIQLDRELREVNEFFSSTLSDLKEDLRRVEDLQKKQLPQRFSEIKGARVASRYFSGIAPGGDYFDFAESADGACLTFVLSSVNSYGLSSAFLSAVQNVSAKVSPGLIRKRGGCAQVGQKILAELAPVFKEKNQLSLFFGTLIRKEQIFRFVNIGGTAFFRFAAEALPRQEAWQWMEASADRVTKSTLLIAVEEMELNLQTGDRLIWISAGAIDILGGIPKVLIIVKELDHAEALDLVNEIMLKIRANLETPDSMPPRDCTVIVLDLNSPKLTVTPSVPVLDLE